MDSSRGAESKPVARRSPREPGPLPRLSPRADIQGLRALAVVLVLLDHAGVAWLGGGFVGVDVFFVVSGFLISSLLLHEATTTGRVRVGLFYARRARRILPAAALVLATTAVFAATRLSVTRVSELVGDVRWSALFAANVHFSRLGVDYFTQDRAVSPVQHYWSLAVEEQFYLVWPAVLLVVFVLLARHRLAATVAVVAGTWLASLAWSVLLTSRSPVAAYFSSMTRAWELATGVLLALAGNHLHRLSRTARHLLSGGGLAAILLAAVSFDGSTPFPGWRALLPVLGTAAVLAAGAEGPVGPGRLLTVSPVRYVGDVSYSLYLWHWPVLLLGAEFVGSGPVGTVELVGVAALLSALSYHLVENPVRHSRGRLVRGRRALTLWPVAVSAVLVAGSWANATATNAFEARVHGLSDGARPALTAPVDASGTRSRAAVSHEPQVRRTRPIPVLIGDALLLADRRAPIPFPLVNLEHLDRDVWQHGFHCYAGWGEPAGRMCPLGDVHARRTIAVYGDSHAGMWLPPLSAIGKEAGYRVVPFVKLGCGPFDVEQLEQGVRSPDCPAFRFWALARIERLHPDLVLLAYRGLWAVAPAPGQSAVGAWAAGVSSSVTRLSSLAPEVKVIGDITALDFTPADCLTGPHSTMATCTQRAQQVTRTANAATRRATERSGGTFVDVTGTVCLRQRCPLVVDGVVTYRDSAHISLTWSTRLTRHLARALRLPYP